MKLLFFKFDIHLFYLTQTIQFFLAIPSSQFPDLKPPPTRKTDLIEPSCTEEIERLNIDELPFAFPDKNEISYFELSEGLVGLQIFFFDI